MITLKWDEQGFSDWDDVQKWIEIDEPAMSFLAENVHFHAHYMREPLDEGGFHPPEKFRAMWTLCRRAE